MELYKILSNNELQIAQKIRQRRLQMLVHSVIYYNLDQNIISDNTWSKWATELAELQNKYPEISSKVEDYRDDFKDWDGSSGAFLPLDDEWANSKARQLLNINSKKMGTKPLFRPKIEDKPKKSKVKTMSNRLF